MNKIINLADKVGSPSYLFDIDAFRQRADLVKSAFGPKVKLCFSIKANPFLLPYLPDVFDKIEVCSPGELTICEKTGMDMSKVIFSGVNKKKIDVERAAEDNVGIFTAESRLHMSLINDAALCRNKTYPVLVRVADNSQFGMDESEIFDIIKNREDYQGIKIVGIHYFTGTGKRKAKSIVKELNYLEELVLRIRQELDFDIEKIEYGTGLGVDYFDDNADDIEKERLFEISDAIKSFADKIDLTVEMGRFFAAPCGYYFTKIIDTKTNSGVNYAICDGGLNHLKYDGQLQGMKIMKTLHVESGKSDPKEWTVCGSLCTTADVLVRNLALSDLKIGDTLIFTRVGAYSVSEGMALFLSRELPSVYVFGEKIGLKKLRDVLDASSFNTPKEI